MKTYHDLYEKICSMGNLTLAWRKARKGKTQRFDVRDFEENLEKNLLALHSELVRGDYMPRNLTTFVLRDPKTRVISKSDFRDRIVHHALINVIGEIFEKGFIYDSCANQKKKGNLFALQRFDTFQRKVTCNFSCSGFCLKADIKHYFQEIDHTILIRILCRKIDDEKVLLLIEKILNNTNSGVQRERDITFRGMPLGNLTSQFFANVYLNELDYFIKHVLKVKYYLRYVDDFVLLHHSQKQLENWKIFIEIFLAQQLKLCLHPHKSRIISLYRGVDFIGFRNYKKWKLLRKRNIRNMRRKIGLYYEGKICFETIFDSFCGWNAYSLWADSYILREEMKKEIIGILLRRV